MAIATPQHQTRIAHFRILINSVITNPNSDHAIQTIVTPENKITRFTSGLWLTLAMFILLAIAFTVYSHAEKAIDRANELRYLSFQLADELHQSSDELTRMVRTYVITGDPLYKQHYQDILDIRDGKKPRPNAYHEGFYWDLILAQGKPQHPGLSSPIPLLKLMQQANFTEQEFQKLSEAKANSEALTKTEFEAMRLFETTGAQAENNKAVARQILHDQKYHQAKTSIMKPIDEFYDLMDKRTLEAVHQAESYALTLRGLFIAIGLALIFTLRRTYVALTETLGGPIGEVHAQIAKIGSGDFSTDITTPIGQPESILGWLAQTKKQLSSLDLQQKQAQAQARRLSQLYAALSQCNQAIVRCANEQQLFPIMCQDAVEFGGMKMAWIGLLDADTQLVKPVASFGVGTDYLQDIQISTDPSQAIGRGPTGTAIRESHPVWCQDFLNTIATAPWHERGKEFGWHSSASLPLRRNNKVVGTFTFYSSEINAFDESAQTLLIEMASDISFALTSYATEENRKKTESELKIAAKVFAQSSEGFMVTDASNNIISTNKAFTDITGYSAEEALGKNPRILSSGRHNKDFYQTIWAAIQTQSFWAGEIWNRRKDGSLFPAWLTISRVIDEQGHISEYVGTLNDITQRKKSEENIHRLAHFDALTGLPNRTLLNDRFTQAIGNALRNQEKIAVLFLDLDHFKNINDTLGHRIGDEILIEVAKRMVSTVRDVDTVSRLGGDEFILVLSNIDANGAAHVAEKLLATISRSYLLAGQELAITPSIGIAMYPNDGTDIDSLSMCADTAMYRAKQDGRNNFRFFAPEMQTKSSRALLLDNALRNALERNQFSLHYQPQISMQNGRVVGAEALLRWNHPELGSISPAEFIPIAESGGQILPIGEWVLRTTAQQLSQWIAAGMTPLTIAVNLSAVQFRLDSFPELVSKILEEAKLPPRYLELELTEGVAMEDPNSAIQIMDELHHRGIRMSIDDFGTGYSSLSYLKRFKIYKLKIDQSFVRDISVDPEDKAIVSAVISLASSLGMKTIAEGVETSEQMAFLRLQGCDEIQGYYFSKPLPADEFLAYLQAH